MGLNCCSTIIFLVGGFHDLGQQLEQQHLGQLVRIILCPNHSSNLLDKESAAYRPFLVAHRRESIYLAPNPPLTAPFLPLTARSPLLTDMSQHIKKKQKKGHSHEVLYCHATCLGFLCSFCHARSLCNRTFLQVIGDRSKISEKHHVIDYCDTVQRNRGVNRADQACLLAFDALTSQAFPAYNCHFVVIRFGLGETL